MNNTIYLLKLQIKSLNADIKTVQSEISRLQGTINVGIRLREDYLNTAVKQEEFYENAKHMDKEVKKYEKRVERLECAKQSLITIRDNLGSQVVKLRAEQ